MKLYGLNWKYSDPLEVEISCIRNGGKWKSATGHWYGEGLFHHYKAFQSILWPWKKWDRWSELALQKLIDNKLIMFAGPANSTKTHSVAAFMLSRYICFPKTFNMVSSTDMRSLELRIWGEIKKLLNMARARFPDTPGRLIESKQMLVTDIEDEMATDYRNGIIGVPVVVGGELIGLSRLQGIKNAAVFLAADELSAMPLAFYDAISNLNKNRNFKCAGMGNPSDRTNTFGKLCEPAIEIGGWEKYEPTGKTMVWKTRFPGGECIQLDGRDTPNGDAPEDALPYPYLISKQQIKDDEVFFGADSYQVAMMDYGIFPRDAQAKRVITRSLCERFRALEPPTWGHEPLTKLFGIDAAYGAVGGDRCVGVELAFGRCTDGLQRLAFAGQPIVIPVKEGQQDYEGRPVLPEDQIAYWVKTYCESAERNIPPEHVAFDSTGRGSLVAAFGRAWSNDVVPVEFGGQPSERFVSEKIKVPCKNYYYTFVAELWFAVATLIASDQLRGLPTSVMEEGCLRGWEFIKDKKIAIETKEKCKERMTRSPDIFDAFAVGVELARRLGLLLGQSGSVSIGKMPEWLSEMVSNQNQLRKRHSLAYR